MKKLLLVVSIFSFISRMGAQQCWPLGWSKGLSSTTYTYTFEWPSNFGAMDDGLTLTYSQMQTEISSAIASAFSSWGSSAGLSYGSGGHFFLIRFDYTYSGGTYSNFTVTFDLASPFYFSTPCPSDRFYFLTMALHEIGNAFVGGDAHNDNDPNSAMHTVTRGRVVTGLSSCDEHIILLYCIV